MKGFNFQNLFLMFAIIIAVFSALFLFYANEVQNSTVPISVGLNDTYKNLTAEFDNINASVGAVKDKALGLSEAKSGGVVGLVITTVDGFSATIKLMKESLTFGLNTITILLRGIGLPIPEWAVALLFIVMTVIVIFALLRAISGRVEI